MAQCKNCGTSGFFLFLTSSGLCEQCAKTVAYDVKEKVYIITDCIEQINKSDKIDAVAFSYDLLIKTLNELKMYERKGLKVLQISPSEMISKVIASKDELIVQATRREVDKILSKAQFSSSEKTAVTAAKKALERIAAAKRLLTIKILLDSLQKHVEEFISKTTLNALIQAAKKYEFKGQFNKAIDKYTDALFFLKSDQIDDALQIETITDIETAISRIRDGKDNGIKTARKPSQIPQNNVASQSDDGSAIRCPDGRVVYEIRPPAG